MNLMRVTLGESNPDATRPVAGLAPAGCTPAAARDDVAAKSTDSALNGFLDLVVQLAGAIAGAIRVVTPPGRFRLAASVGLPNELRVVDSLMPLSCGICGAAIRDDDTRRATRTIGCRLRDSGVMCGGKQVHCAIAVPLDYQNRPIGVLNLFFAPEREPPDCVSQLLRPFGQLLGMAFENERLSRENLQASVVAERQAMAAEIHDAVAQSLTFARMRMSLLENVLGDNAAARGYCADINGELRYAHGRLREVITHFRAGMDARGLVATLREAAASFVERSGIELDFTPPETEPELTAEQARQVFGIVQEALANVRKHARAQRARLSIQPCNDSFEVVIEDDGCGFDARRPSDAPAEDDEHYGIAIMHERAERAGGCLRIDSPVSGGTRVRLLVPAANRREQS
ncbi:MAG TPA: histidine kinase [Burkholderiaceae bacterium]|nr:histidine kinase [Burkholderiaceae bacterium]